MKTKGFAIVISILMAAACFALFTACKRAANDRSGNRPDASYSAPSQPGGEEEGAQVNIAFKTLTVKDQSAYGTVPGDQTTYSFLNEITVGGNAKYTVSYDIGGSNVIPSKTAELKSGDNVFYIVEYVDDEPQRIYDVTIRRRPLYRVTFDTRGGTAVEEQTVEEGGVITGPSSTRTGYTFESWDYDFSKPITEDTGVTAIWSTKTEFEPFDFDSSNTTCTITGVKDKSVTSITIPDGVTDIGDYAFAGCSGLTSVNVAGSVTSIGEGAFSSCSGLTSIIIPNSVTSIGNWAFRNCSGLTSVNWNATNCTSAGSSNYPIFSGCTILTTITIAENVTYIPAYAFYGCSGLTSITIGGGVTSIGKGAFDRCSSLKSMVIPSSVTSIGDGAFAWCESLTEVTIPDGVTYVGNSVFSGCSGLTSITIGVGVKSIGMDAFMGCVGLTSIAIPDGVVIISYGAFKGCSGLTSVVIGSGVTMISDYAFEDCKSLSSVTFKNTSGWYVSTSSAATIGTDVTVTTPTQNATYLKLTYLDHYWKRKQ